VVLGNAVSVQIAKSDFHHREWYIDDLLLINVGIPGDGNSDGNINVLDVIGIINNIIIS
jgi:hypothetical protein